MAFCAQCSKETTEGGRYCPYCGATLGGVEPSVALGSPSETLAPGALFASKFRVLRELGRGAFGVVYEARDTLLDRLVAIKTIRGEGFRSEREREDFEKRFLREARSVARLHHPNVISVFEAGQEHGISYIVMELVRGKTLRTLCNERGALPLAQALTIIQPLLGALGAAHAEGIVHRDVKPENVMITDGGALKVTDFGLAKAASVDGGTLTRDGSILGTPS